MKPSSFALEKSPALWGEPRFCDQLSEHHFLPFVFAGSISQPFAEELRRTPILAVASDLGPRFPLNGMWCTARGWLRMTPGPALNRGPAESKSRSISAFSAA